MKTKQFGSLMGFKYFLQVKYFQCYLLSVKEIMIYPSPLEKPTNAGMLSLILWKWGSKMGTHRNE